MRSGHKHQDGYRRQIRQDVWERDGKRCVYCSRPLSRASMTIDHELAIGNGGGDDLNNVVLACRRCNSIKSNLTLEQFREKMKWQLSDMPHFSPDQIAYLKKWHGIVIEPRDTRFWAERRASGEPPMIRPTEQFTYDGAKRRIRNKDKGHG